MRIVICIAMLLTSGLALAQQVKPLTNSLHFAYQRASGPAMRFIDCDKDAGSCRHDMDRGAYVIATGDGKGTPIDELAAYFGPDKPGAAQATLFVMASMKLFSPSTSESIRGAAVRQIVESAATSRRGEVTLNGVKYVLRGSDGNDIRVYVTLR